jgi:serine/threonine-protein kinase
MGRENRSGSFGGGRTAGLVGGNEPADRELYRARAGLYAAAFAADPKLADGVHADNRYDAACAAALAGCGRGEDSPADEAERARLRSLALGWLTDHLVFTSRHLASGKSGASADVRQWLHHWQTDTDLAGVRDSAALAKLPTDERAAWERLWADVAALLKKAEAPATEGKP